MWSANGFLHPIRGKRGNIVAKLVTINSHKISTVAPDATDLFEGSEVFNANSGHSSWLKSTKTILKGTKGPYYLGRHLPFPYNPQFRPKAPISDGLRSKIYLKWYQSPQELTVKELSTHFRVSKESVEAAIRLMNIAHHNLSAGFQIDSSYLGRMEEAIQKASPGEDPANGNSFISTLEQFAKNNEPKTEKKIESVAPNKSLLKDRISPKKFLTSKALEPVKMDLYEKSRWRFVFEDISSKKFVVRERSGLLLQEFGSYKQSQDAAKTGEQKPPIYAK